MFLQDYNISSRKEFPPHILRIAKIARQKSKNNSKAKTEQNQSQNVQTPTLKLKRKRGAPRGNSNALKTGLHTAEMRGLMLQVRQAIAQSRLAVAQARMEATLMDMESRARLRAAGPALTPLPDLPRLAWG